MAKVDMDREVRKAKVEALEQVIAEMKECCTCAEEGAGWWAAIDFLEETLAEYRPAGE